MRKCSIVDVVCGNVSFSLDVNREFWKKKTNKYFFLLKWFLSVALFQLVVFDEPLNQSMCDKILTFFFLDQFHLITYRVNILPDLNGSLSTKFRFPNICTNFFFSFSKSKKKKSSNLFKNRTQLTSLFLLLIFFSIISFLKEILFTFVPFTWITQCESHINSDLPSDHCIMVVCTGNRI